MQDLILKDDALMDFDIRETANVGNHFHQDIELLYIIDGELTLHIDNDELGMKQDDYTIINANRKHSYIGSGDLLVGIIHMNYKEISKYVDLNKVYFHCNTTRDENEVYEKMRKVIYKIFNQYRYKDGSGKIYLNSLYFELLNIIVTNFVVELNDLRFNNAELTDNQRVNEIINYINANYQRKISLDDISNHFYLSKTYISKYIKNKMGVNFIDYLNNVRLQHAVDDLKYTNKTILKIALDNGFPNTASFGKKFKETYNMTPSEFMVKERGKKAKPEEQPEKKKDISERVNKYLNDIELKVVENQAHSYVIVDTMYQSQYVKSWNRMINIGLASDLLRSDLQEQIISLKKELKFEYVRFWDLYSPDLLLNINSPDYKYNFTKLDRVFDFFVENDIKPYIELGFKPILLIRTTSNYFVSKEREILFKNLNEYKKFLYAMVSHYVNRYGIEEVSKWYFEQWGDPRLRKENDFQKYFEVFEAAYDTLKTISPQIKIGGAGLQPSVKDDKFQRMLRLWKKRICYPDFISIYSYSYNHDENFEEEITTNDTRSRDPEFLLNQVKLTRDIIYENGFYNSELHLSEWNSTISNRNCLNDSCYKGTYIMKNIIDTIGMVDIMGYWLGSDLFSEYSDSSLLLNGSVGLLTKDGIKKPSFYAFEFMNHMGDFLLGGNENCIITTNSHGNYSIACHNYKHPNFKYYMISEDQAEITQLDQFFNDNSALKLNFQIKHVKNGIYQIKTRSLNQQNGSIQDEWLRMGLSENLNKQDIEYLRNICTPRITIKTCKVTDGILNFETILQPHEIQYIHLLYQM